MAARDSWELTASRLRLEIYTENFYSSRGSTLGKRRIAAVAASALTMATLVLLLTGCGQSSITTGAPHSSGTPDVADVAVDFFQDEDRTGSVYVRSQMPKGDLIRFFIEVPYTGPGYRLDAVDFEFRSDAIQPLIMLEPAPGTLTQNISFSRVDSVVHLSVLDTGQAGNGTVLFNFVAQKNVFQGNGLQLHAELEFGAGHAVADLTIPPAW